MPQDQKASKRKGQQKSKERSILDKIKALIVEDHDEDEIPIGTGGRKREQSIMDVVDEAVRGADEDNGVKRK